MFAALKPFSHLYVESAAWEYPRTQEIVQRFPGAEVVMIEDYAALFGRNRQDFSQQKLSPKLILAVKKDQFIYDGSSYVQKFDFPNFHYNALVLNCAYDCRYCYLQGMYPGANIVAFVNEEDYFKAAENAISKRPVPQSPLHLAISYDTDLLALENKLGMAESWLDFTEKTPDLVTEVRTKSAVWRPFAERKSCNRFIFAWTLSPQEVAESHELGTPSLRHRLKAAANLGERSWPLRLCFDPLLQIPNASKIYDRFIHEVFATLDPSWIVDASVGVFRINADYFKRMKRLDRSSLLNQPMQREGSTVSYPPDVRSELTSTVVSALSQYLDEKKIFIWT